ncbi:MAG: DUF6614 family protein [Alphaproteobacteria bacterium]
MDLYHIWCDLKPGQSDVEFCRHVGAYLGKLKDEARIAGFRITRRKLGLGPQELGEFHIVVEIDSLAQLETAFQRVAARDEPIEGLHHAVNSRVANARFALYRDFPDAGRKTGHEKF